MKKLPHKNLELESFKIDKKEVKPTLNLNMIPGESDKFSEKISESSKLNFENLFQMSDWDLSQSLPESPDENLSTTDFVENANLEPYQCMNPNHKIQKYNFLDEGNPNLGWKIHLNVSAENSKKVSDYLKNNGYFHKFLSGGDPNDGKIFTVYFGSQKFVEKFSKILSSDLKNSLSKPKAEDEIEFAKGVVGRFVASDTYGQSSLGFSPYGNFGMSYSKHKIELKNNRLMMIALVNQNLRLGKIKTSSEKEKQKWLENLGRINFDLLNDKYAEYFTG